MIQRAWRLNSFRNDSVNKYVVREYMTSWSIILSKIALDNFLFYKLCNKKIHNTEHTVLWELINLKKNSTQSPTTVPA